MNNNNFANRIEALLNKGYTKSSLSKHLEISRGTLHTILSDKTFIPSKTLQLRIKTNLDWCETVQDHDLIDALTLFYTHRKNPLDLLENAVDIMENTTGYHVGYHGLTYGGPGAFAINTSPGVDHLAETDFVNADRFAFLGLARSETLLISEMLRYSGDHEQAKDFFDSKPDAKIYLKLFRSFNFSATKDLKKIIDKTLSTEHQDKIFLLETGLLAGRYDYFILVITEDEPAYLDYLVGSTGVYSITGKNLTDSVTLSVVPQNVRNLFTQDHYNLSVPGQLY